MTTVTLTHYDVLFRDAFRWAYQGYSLVESNDYAATYAMRYHATGSAAPAHSNKLYHDLMVGR